MTNMKKCILGMACLWTVSVAMAQTSLKEAFRDCWRMGVAVNQWQAAGEYPGESAMIARHFDAVVAENCMKCEVIHPQEHVYDFTLADQFVDQANRNGQFVVGHCLIWHSQCAPWFFVDGEGKQISAGELKKRMKEHIFTIVGHFKGRVDAWDVVNEAVEDDGSFRQSKFYEILGENYIRLAFQYAHEADPSAALYYNDFSMAKPAKRDKVAQFIGQLREEGIRVDAIGVQGHLTLDSDSAEKYAEAIEAFAATGAKVMITELDVSALPNPFGHSGANVADRFAYRPEMDPYTKGLSPEAEAAWEKRYLDFFRMLLAHRECIDRVCLWGLTDGNSWRNDFPIKGRTDYALLFDRKAQPKPIVEKLIGLLDEKK